MAPPQDARRVSTPRVCTQTVIVSARAEGTRQSGSVASLKYVDGTGHAIIVERPNGRAQIYLAVKGDFPEVQSTSESCYPTLRPRILPPFRHW
jgi:hypothetical protein